MGLPWGSCDVCRRAAEELVRAAALGEIADRRSETESGTTQTCRQNPTTSPSPLSDIDAKTPSSESRPCLPQSPNHLLQRDSSARYFAMSAAGPFDVYAVGWFCSRVVLVLLLIGERACNAGLVPDRKLCTSAGGAGRCSTVLQKGAVLMPDPM